MNYSRGLIYALLSGVFLSSGGLMVRFLDSADPWTVLFYRSLAFFVTVTLFMMWRYRGERLARLQQLQPRDLLVSLFLALGFVFYLMSLYYTSVAKTYSEGQVLHCHMSENGLPRGQFNFWFNISKYINQTIIMALKAGTAALQLRNILRVTVLFDGCPSKSFSK